MANTSNAAVTADKAESKTSAGKVHEKVVEKRRALGRGLDSLLPGPRAAISSGESRSGWGPQVAPLPVPQAQTAEASAAAPLSVTPASVTPASVAPSFVTPASSGEAAGRVDFIAAEGSAGEPAPIGSEAAPSEAAVERAGVTAAPFASVAAPVAALAGQDVMRLNLDLIDDNPHQTRMNFKEGPLQELAESIRVQGVLQPIVVREAQEGRYTLILGDRRLRASRMAGMETIPAIVKRVSEQQAAEMTLVENLQRQDLNVVEQANAFANLSKDFHLTQDEIGTRVGVSRETVSNYLRLLTLPQNVLLSLLRGELTFSHARVLLTLKTTDAALLWHYAKKAIDLHMPVQKFEDYVAGKFDPAKKPETAFSKYATGGGGARWVDPNVKAAQRSLEEILGMRVRIRDRAGRGRITIEYATMDDFDRVVEMLRGKYHE